jgi:hypothetical protein
LLRLIVSISHKKSRAVFPRRITCIGDKSG